MAEITCRRIDEQTSAEDDRLGKRVRVDRIWPEGMRREGAAPDERLREAAPAAVTSPNWATC
ncbi:hypothetical protein EDD90_9332 [Streptomyces sp. Ag109_O5-1]|uniref:DUF488 family protein, N3 subclade n=1 Tax=Streptomyces sp. Ag109_O5-1 TaxID=1938851 RepID=UPI000F94FAAA|nr:hypothetical protein [Streptomyces sp. Ag109_O5-1]RPE46012.1 hypothetical protein EDD90_9332 [Streptomyces sp. Ag109_O5-1]